MIPYPQIDPVALSIGPLAVRWYSLAYIAGLLLGWHYIRHLDRAPQQVLGKEAREDILLWAMLGVVLGGRLGYVLFYHPLYFLEHPVEIFMLWQGGMSFHGGMLGTITAIWLFCRKHGIGFLPVIDLVACAAPIGLFFGRLANFINGELYGRVTQLPWGMVFPHGGPLPRHPSQLYEAFLEGILLFSVLAWLAMRRDFRKQPGRLAGVFLIGYGLSRFMVEWVRQPDGHLGLLALGLTMGQWLSLPMIALGIYLCWFFCSIVSENKNKDS